MFKKVKKKYTKKDILNYSNIKLRDYQDNASSISLDYDRGIFDFPTGSGKSIIEFDVIYRHILKEKNTPRSSKGVFLINSPRILLSYQLIDEAFKYITSKGEDAIFLLVHSGNQMKNDYTEFKNEVQKMKKKKMHNTKIITTTNSDIIQNQIMLANDLNLPLIICSTYHSMHKVQSAINHEDTNKGKKVKDLINLNMIINDEAHYLTEKVFFDTYRNMKADKNFFFTATKKTTESSKNGVKGISMDNKDIFGDIIAHMSNKEAVDRGLITPIRGIFTNADKEYIEEDYQKSIPHLYKKCFEDLDEKTHCAKLLIAVRGLGDIMNFFKSNEYKSLIKKGVEVFSVASNKIIGNNINGSKMYRVEDDGDFLERTKGGQPINRSDFLRELQLSGNDPAKMIVLHYDILTEGVDANGFNGFLPMRTMCKTKARQNIGRCVRRNPLDRYKLENGEASPYDFDEFIKPFAYVYLTNVILGDGDKIHNLMEVIYEMRYKDSPIEEVFIHDDTADGMGESDDGDKKGMHYINKIKKLEHIAESELDIVLSEEDFINDIFDEFKI